MVAKSKLDNFNDVRQKKKRPVALAAAHIETPLLNTGAMGFLMGQL